MEDRIPPSRTIRILGPFLFIVLATDSLVCSFSEIYDVLFAERTGVFVFEKTSLYCIGATIAAGFLGFMLVRELWFGRIVSKELMSFCTRWALFGFFLMFALPQGAHYLMEPHWLNSGYKVCELASERSLRYSRIVYITHEELCTEALKLRFE